MEYRSDGIRKKKNTYVFLIPILQYSIAPSLHPSYGLRASFQGPNPYALRKIEHEDLSVSHTAGS